MQVVAQPVLGGEATHQVVGVATAHMLPKSMCWPMACSLSGNEQAAKQRCDNDATHPETNSPIHLLAMGSLGIRLLYLRICESQR